ncbi:MAG: mechanosensitive ion channel [Acidobacteria bacterium]|nr:mechanosensitive ion channel [Acidobacteriota bacterium]
MAEPATYVQLGIVAAAIILASLIAGWLRHYLPALTGAQKADGAPRPATAAQRSNRVIVPLLAATLLRISVDISLSLLDRSWLVQAALALAVVLLFHAFIRDVVRSRAVATSLLWLGLVVLGLHYVGLLERLVAILDSIALTIGSIHLSLYGLVRAVLFGLLLFWLGRLSNSTGQDIIRRQQQLDQRTREVASKALQVSIVAVVFLLLLQVMGVNLTALAVFGGAVGVGLGFGLQAIASNFISGIIILLDRSVSVDDYIQLEDGRTGIVRELNMRSTTLETFDGKDVMVPNEKFIVETFTNWTHKNKKQRYRVDFPVAYHSDIRALVPIIRSVVASHPQVISGDDVPIEERPDCEIDSFGDSGINMFVEFWMDGIDDGKNRVGGDLLLMILEALREHGFDIPFPQREVRMLGDRQDKGDR